jgi:hypothetical protein
MHRGVQSVSTAGGKLGTRLGTPGLGLKGAEANPTNTAALAFEPGFRGLR